MRPPVPGIWVSAGAGISMKDEASWLAGINYSPGIARISIDAAGSDSLSARRAVPVAPHVTRSRLVRCAALVVSRRPACAGHTVAKVRNLRWIEAGEGRAKGVSFLQDPNPGQPGRKPFQHQHLPQHARVLLGNAPLHVMIGAYQRASFSAQATVKYHHAVVVVTQSAGERPKYSARQYRRLVR